MRRPGYSRPRMDHRGRLITIEGIDGAGKTTLAERLVSALPGARLLREPGGVGLSERVRALVKDPGLTVDARAEALLYAAARAQLVHERVLPLLESGTHVLLDRFVDSSLAYQGAGRGLGVREIAELNRFGTAGLVPDRTLYLRVPPAVGASRRDGEDRRGRGPGGVFAAVVEGEGAGAGEGARPGGRLGAARPR